MKRIMLLIFAAILCIVTGCSVSGQNTGSNDTAKSYTQISQEEAREMMAKDDGHIVVDVRRQDEYDAGHTLSIAGAATAASRRRRSSAIWATPTSTNSAASTHGQVKS